MLRIVHAWYFTRCYSGASPIIMFLYILQQMFIDVYYLAVKISMLTFTIIDAQYSVGRTFFISKIQCPVPLGNTCLFVQINAQDEIRWFTAKDAAYSSDVVVAAAVVV